MDIDEEKDQLFSEVWCFLLAHVRKYPKVGSQPRQHKPAVDWILGREIVRRYLRLGPKVKVPGYYDDPCGSTLTEPREIIEYLLEDAHDYLVYRQREHITIVYDRLTATERYSKLSKNQQAVLRVLHEHCLEDGIRVLFSNSFIAERLAVSEDIHVDPSRAGKLLDRLVQLRYVELVDPGARSWVAHERRSRVVSLYDQGY